VVAWGLNGSSQTTVPAGLTGVTAIAAGHHYTVALKNDGTVVLWGYRNGLTVPPGLTGVTAIAACNMNILALKNDGTVVEWGNSLATAPSGLGGVTAIAAGGFHGVALKDDGTVVSWGCGYAQFNYGQCIVPMSLAGVTAIAASNLHTVAVYGTPPPANAPALGSVWHVALAAALLLSAGLAIAMVRGRST
jgi:alpha-tubulin suppressor-like RCC1 family protein